MRRRQVPADAPFFMCVLELLYHERPCSTAWECEQGGFPSDTHICKASGVGRCILFVVIGNRTPKGGWFTLLSA